LIEIGVRQAAAAGIARIVVVTGHWADELEDFLGGLSLRLGLPIVTERLADWSRPNGWSVLAGAGRIEGSYLLLMADHLFEVEILSRLLREDHDDRAVTLAIDRRCDHPSLDPADATWVRTGPQGRIAAIGKAIHPYDAVDCGAFLATPELADAIAAAIAGGAPGSLSDGMQRLAEKGRAATMDVGEAWWLDVDDPRALALAETQAPERVAARAL
jgi:choline kinase